MTDEVFAGLVRKQPVEVLLLAFEQVKTVQGAIRLLRAEQVGLNRAVVRRIAERRIAQLRQQELPGQRVALIAQGVAMETEEIRFWNQRRER